MKSVFAQSFINALAVLKIPACAIMLDSQKNWVTYIQDFKISWHPVRDFCELLALVFDHVTCWML